VSQCVGVSCVAAVDGDCEEVERHLRTDYSVPVTGGRRVRLTCFAFLTVLNWQQLAYHRLVALCNKRCGRHGRHVVVPSQYISRQFLTQLLS